MARAHAELIVAAGRPEVWAVVSDPRHLPRWWPGVERIEAVEADGAFTAVMPSKDGRGMRLDYQGRAEPFVLYAWDLELAGTPFARVLTHWSSEVRLSEANDGAGTRVQLTESTMLRGSYRLGGLLQRRPARARLTGAADGLRALFA